MYQKKSLLDRLTTKRVTLERGAALPVKWMYTAANRIARRWNVFLQAPFAFAFRCDWAWRSCLLHRRNVRTVRDEVLLQAGTRAGGQVGQDSKHDHRCVCSPIYTRQDVVRKWTRSDFLSVAGNSKFLVEHFLMGILSRSWSFHIRTWTRNAKLTRLIIFISFKIWHRCAPRNTIRNAASFWIFPYRQKVASG